MNPKRLVLAIVAVFAGVFATDFLIHGVWLQSLYSQTMSLWRPEAAMREHFHWLLLGQLIFAVPFVVVWAKGFASTGGLMHACRYGLCMALFSQAGTFISFAVQPLPRELAVKWVVSGLVQGVILGLIVFYTYKPTQAGPAAAPGMSEAKA